MSISDTDKARELAENLADELLSSLDQEMLEEAKAMGMAASIFANQIEEYRNKYNAEVTEEIADNKLFDNAVSDRINE